MESILFPKPVVENDRCLRSSPGRSRCTACQEACPVPGFHLNGGKLILPDDCISCHFCTASCPEGAILGMLPPIHLLSKAKIVLRCERVHREEVTAITCIGAIPVEFLKVAAVRKRSVRLITGPCKECKRQAGLAIFEQRAAQVHKAHPLDWHHCEQPFSEIPERRRLMEWLGRSVMNRRIGTTDYLESLPRELTAEAEGIRPVFTDQCIGCPVCEVVCPHRVFHRDETDTGIRYQVVEQRCTGCEKCVDSCLFQGVTLADSSNRRARTVELGRRICSDCNEEFTGRAGGCPRCRMTGTQGGLIPDGKTRSADTNINDSPSRPAFIPQE